MSDKKAPNEIDRQVGSRVRMYRTMRGLSQERLGEALGVTFQQIQKYEKGTNRISASRLQQIAETFDVTIGNLYSGQEPSTGSSGFAESTASYQGEDISTEGWKLQRAFNRIRDARLRRKLIEIATIFASGEGDEADERSK